jgi:hypothetical protein
VFKGLAQATLRRRILPAHRHSYRGVLSLNSPLRTAVMDIAAAHIDKAMAQVDAPATGDGARGVAPLGNAISPAPKPAAAHYLRAVLIARIYVVFALFVPPK